MTDEEAKVNKPFKSLKSSLTKDTDAWTMILHSWNYQAQLGSTIKFNQFVYQIKEKHQL